MLLSQLFEDRKGKTQHSIRYKHLYHMADNHSFSYAVQENALRSKNYGYVSTTWDPKMNRFVGGDHAHFKFVLNAPALARDYGVFTYDFHATEVGPGGTRRTISLNEREIGIDTPSIEPLRSYCEGLILLFPMFSQTAIQWLLYDNPARGYTLGSGEQSSAMRGIEALHTFQKVWKLPVQVGGESFRPLTSQEQGFLDKAWRIHQQGGDFHAAMRRLVVDYPVKDHFGKDLDRATVLRLLKGAEIERMFNTYFSGRAAREVDVSKLKRIVEKSMSLMRLNSNIQKTIMDAAEQAGLFHPTTPPVAWTGIFRRLAYGDVGGALEDIKYESTRNKWARERYATDSFIGSGQHVGTGFAKLEGSANLIS